MAGKWTSSATLGDQTKSPWVNEGLSTRKEPFKFPSLSFNQATSLKEIEKPLNWINQLFKLKKKIFQSVPLVEQMDHCLRELKIRVRSLESDCIRAGKACRIGQYFHLLQNRNGETIHLCAHWREISQCLIFNYQITFKSSKQTKVIILKKVGHGICRSTSWIMSQ